MNYATQHLEPETDGIKITHLKLNNQQYLEIIFYSILRLASNMLRLDGKYFDIGREMCAEFKRHYNISSRNLPEEILSLKEGIRNGKKFSSKEIEELKNESLEFINQCEDFLRKS